MTEANRDGFSFTAIIQKAEDMDAAYVIVPPEVWMPLSGGRGRVRVRAEFDGAPYEGSVVNMGVKDGDGNICRVIGIPKAIRRSIGKQPGDLIRVLLWERK